MTSDRERRVLFVAYHFPPLHGSSGLLRTLKFVKYLPDFGIRPYVLTVNPRAYDNTSDGLLAQIPTGVTVHRAFALDAKKHLSFRGAYPGILALPDKVASWIPFGIAAGLRLLTKYKIDLIYSTYPIASAHVIAAVLSRLTRRSWIAEFRDPIWDDHMNLDRVNLQTRMRIEESCIRYARKLVTVTRGIQDLMAARYPQLPSEQFLTIPNGFDEEDFAGIKTTSNGRSRRFHLIHAGLLDPVDRDARPFLEAIRQFMSEKPSVSTELRFDFYSSGHDTFYQTEVDRLGLKEVVNFLPGIPYDQIIQRMAEADILLLFQGGSCNEQIPAKAYEYLRIGKPILTLAPASSATAGLVMEASAGEVVNPDDPGKIARVLSDWTERYLSDQPLPIPDRFVVDGYSRRNQTKVLANAISEVVDSDED